VLTWLMAVRQIAVAVKYVKSARCPLNDRGSIDQPRATRPKGEGKPIPTSEFREQKVREKR
jgi:hypothetical protein